MKYGDLLKEENSAGLAEVERIVQEFKRIFGSGDTFHPIFYKRVTYDQGDTGYILNVFDERATATIAQKFGLMKKKADYDHNLLWTKKSGSGNVNIILDMMEQNTSIIATMW
jgi:hypothetical protein